MGVKKQRFFGITMSLSCYQNLKLKSMVRKMMKMTMVDSSLGEKYRALMQKWEKE
jgi:hypothetical protein